MTEHSSRRSLPFTVRRLGGKLLGNRVADVRSRDDWTEFSHRIHDVLRESTTRLVVCTDLRGLRALPPDLHDLLVDRMREMNPYILRSALLLPNPALEATLAGLLRSAGSDDRQLFHTSADVKAWLSFHLGAEDRSHLDAFLVTAGAA